MEELDDRSVSDKELPRIIQQLINKSSELDIEIISIKPREDIKADAAGQLPRGVTKAYIEMILRCPYNVLGDYLGSLRDIPMILTVEDLYVEKMPEEEDVDGQSQGEGKDIFSTLIISTYTVLKF